MVRRTIIGGLIAVVVAACIAGLLVRLRGCGTPQEEPQDLAYQQFLTTTGDGHLGKLSAGPAEKRWSAYVPFYRDGALQVSAPQVCCYGAERRPAFLLIERLAYGVPYNLGGGLSSDGSSLVIRLGQNDADGKPFPVEWRATGVPVGKAFYPATPLFSESITLGGKPYKLEEGRVFLVDLSKAPPAVQQVDADLIEYFQGAEDVITRAELVGIVARLEGLESAVKSFREKVPKP